MRGFRFFAFFPGTAAFPVCQSIHCSVIRSTVLLLNRLKNFIPSMI